MDSVTPRVLLVPGALSGAWIWSDNFAAAFTGQGFAVEALQFPAHGAGWLTRQRQRFEDCVSLCARRIGAAPEAPWVMGHSMGGLVALHAACRAPVRGLVLLSPVPIDGIGRSLLQLARQDPVSMVKLLAVMVESRISLLGSPPVGIYSVDCPPDQVRRVTAQLRSESIPTVLRLLRPPPLDRQALSSVPILLIGAEGDYIIPADEVRRTATALKADCQVYPGMSHTYQAESAWPQVAGDILEWMAAALPETDASNASARKSIRLRTAGSRPRREGNTA